MTGDGAAGASLAPEAARLIDAYLTDLAARTGARPRAVREILDEMRADLIEAVHAHPDREADPAHAVRQVLTAFGDAATVAAALGPELAIRRHRRLGLILLGTGPVVGATWLATALTGDGDLNPVRLWLALLVPPLLLIGVPATLLTVAASGALGTRWLRPPATLSGGAVTVAGTAAALADLALVVGGLVALLAAPHHAPPVLALAAAASTARLTFLVRTASTGRGLPVVR
jgi:hypothetical protein